MCHNYKEDVFSAPKGLFTANHQQHLGKEQEALINQLQVKKQGWCLKVIVELIVQDTVPSTGHTQLLQGYGFEAGPGMVTTLCA